jgi:crossover junction endodeoxyribonuclease RuvC
MSSKANSKPTTNHYAGFDLSLTASGIVILDYYGNVKESHVIKVKSKGSERLDDIQKLIRSIISRYNIELVCIEGYATGAVGKTYHIGELGGVIRLLLHRMKIPYIDPKPTQVKKYATGKGGGEGGSKDQVTLHVFKKWNFEAKDNNEADAYVLARIALALCDRDCGLASYQKEVIAQIQNPVKKTKKGKADE